MRTAVRTQPHPTRGVLAITPAVQTSITLVLSLLCSLSQPLAADPEPPERRALLIGINAYDSKDIPDLRGAVNDIEAMRQVLTSRFGYRENQIATLVDQQATRAAILAALRAIAQQAGPGDIVYIHFSGHGSQVKDLDGDETDDAMDETLVPHDGRTGDVRDITDDELGAILAELQARETLVVLDSCHSGTATRSLGVLTRSLPPDTRIELYAPTTTRDPVGTRSAREVASLQHVLMTGAAAHQSALDGPIDGQYRGFFSHALAAVLGETGPDASPIEILAGVTQQFQRIKEQFNGMPLPEPQLEAPQPSLQQPLFPSLGRPPGGAASAQAAVSARPFVTAQAEGAGRVRLLRGTSMGAVPDSYWAIYPPGEQRFVPGQATATTRITHSADFDALGELDPRNAQIQAGSRAVPISAPPPSRAVSVWIDAAPAIRAPLQQAIQRRQRDVEFVTQNDFARFIVDVNDPACANCAPDVIVFDASGLAERDRFPWVSSDNAADRLIGLFSRSLNAAAITSLTNPAAQMALDVRVVSGSRTRGVALIPSGQTAQYQIRRQGEARDHHNSLMLEIRAGRDCYLTVVDIDTEGKVTVLFPNRYQKPDFHPDGFVRGATPVRIPDSLDDANRAGFFWDYVPPAGVDVVQVFASPDRATAEKIRRYVETASAEATTRGAPRSSVEALRAELAQPEGHRGIATVEAGLETPVATNASPVRDWTAVSVDIRIAP